MVTLNKMHDSDYLPGHAWDHVPGCAG